jgi:hypothetical protein
MTWRFGRIYLPVFRVEDESKEVTIRKHTLLPISSGFLVCLLFNPEDEDDKFLRNVRRYNPENDTSQSASFIPEAQDKWKCKGVWGYERIRSNDPSFTLRWRVAFRNEISLRPPPRSCVGATSSEYSQVSARAVCRLALQGQGRDALAPQRIDRDSAASRGERGTEWNGNHFLLWPASSALEHTGKGIGFVAWVLTPTK